MRKIVKVIMVALMVLSLASCGKSEKKQKEKDPNEKYYGIWKLAEVEINGSTYTVEELEEMGKVGKGGFYLVIKEGGSIVLVDRSNDTVNEGNWQIEEEQLIAGDMKFVYSEDGNLEKIDEGSYPMTFKKYSSSQSVTSVPKLKTEEKEETDKTEEKTPEPEKQPEPEKKTGISKEFKDAMDSYEEFFDEYVAFMKKFNKSDNKTSMMIDYAKFMAQYAETMDKLDKVKNDDLTDEELKYYTEVMLRIDQKLLEAIE